MNNNPINQKKIIVKRLERKPRQNYVKTLASLKNIVEEIDKLYNQFDSQEQALRKRKVTLLLKSRNILRDTP